MSISTMISDKRRYRQYRARTEQLPTGYRDVARALERYLMLFGPGDGGDVTAMLEDLAELFERGAADRIPIRDMVGEDPVEFADAFLRNYATGQWIRRERERLIDAVAHAEQGEHVARGEHGEHGEADEAPR